MREQTISYATLLLYKLKDQDSFNMLFVLRPPANLKFVILNPEAAMFITPHKMKMLDKSNKILRFLVFVEPYQLWNMKYKCSCYKCKCVFILLIYAYFQLHIHKT